MDYDHKKYNEGSRWYDQKLKIEVELLYTRNVVDFRKENGECYGVMYSEVNERMVKLNDYVKHEEFKEKEKFSVTPEKLHQFSFGLYSAKQENESDEWIVDISQLTNLGGHPDVVNVFVYDEHNIEVINDMYFKVTFDRHLMSINFQEKYKGYVLLK